MPAKPAIPSSTPCLNSKFELNQPGQLIEKITPSIFKVYSEKTIALALEKQSLATRAIRGVFWTGSASLVQLFVPLILYGYLPPEQMGRFEGALIIVMLVALLGGLGLGEALVQYRHAGELHFSSAFWATLLFGLAVTFLVMAAAPLVAPVFSRENPAEFHKILTLLSLLIPFASVSGIFRARLQRGLRFRSMALAEVVSAAVYALVVLALLSPFGLLSPIVGSIAREFAYFISLWAFAGWRPSFCFRLSALRQILPFGLNFTGSRGVNFLNSHLATFVIMPLLGETAHGYYKFAHRLTLLPQTRLSTIFSRVTFPTFSTLQEDDALLRQSYLKSAQGIGLFLWPALVGLLVFAPEILHQIQSINGQEIMAALVPLRLLALATLLKAISMATGSIFMAKGRTDWSLYWSLFSFAVSTPALYFATAYGVAGVAAAIALTTLVFLVLTQHLVNRLIGLGFASYLGALVRPGLVAMTVLAVLVAIQPLLPVQELAALVFAFVCGLLSCVMALRLFAWDLCREYWRGFRGRRTEVLPAPPDQPLSS